MQMWCSVNGLVVGLDVCGLGSLIPKNFSSLNDCCSVILGSAGQQLAGHSCTLVEHLPENMPGFFPYFMTS